MAIREYIGARYVPKFYDDGQGNAEWTNRVAYEPLTIVLHEGNSYTSRQYVPIGVDITNTKYWLETGNWNSQVESYRREVFALSDRIDENAAAIENEKTTRSEADEDLRKQIGSEVTARKNADTALDNRINAEATARQNADTALGGRIDAEATARQNADTALGNRIDALTNNPTAVQKLEERYFIFIGDSYQVGTTAGGTTKSFLDIIQEYKVIPNDHLWRAQKGGAGFTISNNTFLQLLQGINMSAENKKKITDIVVTGCYNDANNIDNIISAMKTFRTYVNTNYPNAMVTVIPAGWRRFDGNSAQTFANLYNSVHNWYKGANQCGFHYAGSAHSLLARIPWYISTDGIHPKAEGYQALADVVLNVLTGSDDTFQTLNYMNLGKLISIGDGITISNEPLYVLPRGNDVQYCTTVNVQVNYAENARPSVHSRGGILRLASNKNAFPYVFPNGPYAGGTVPAILSFKADGDTAIRYASVPVNLGVNNDGELIARLNFGGKTDGTFGNITVYAIYFGMLSFDSIA